MTQTIGYITAQDKDRHWTSVSLLPHRVLLQRGSGLEAPAFQPSSQPLAMAHWSRRAGLLSSTTKMAALPSPVRRERWGCSGGSSKPTQQSFFLLTWVQMFFPTRGHFPKDFVCWVENCIRTSNWSWVLFSCFRGASSLSLWCIPMRHILNVVRILHAWLFHH